MRKSYNGQLCTIKYSGPLPVWDELAYGVEWDTPSRGKHSGTLDGHQYFQCRVENAGSFLKISKPSDPGVSFTQALSTKYAQQHTFSEVILSDHKRVESVGMEKYFKRHQQISSLKTISLEYCCIDSFDLDDHTNLSNLRDLNLANNLFEDLALVLEFASRLNLQKLDLRGNRFSTVSTGTATLPTITELNLGSTLLTPSELTTILEAFPNLERLGISHNYYTEYPIGKNNLSWIDIAYNQLESLPPSGPTLVATNNKISTIKSTLTYDYLNICDQDTPTRLNLTEIDNLIVSELWLSEAQYDRTVIIGRLGSLVKLNGTVISANERRECELFLVSQLNRKLQPPLPSGRQEYLWSVYGPPKIFSSNSIAARLAQVRVAGECYQIVGDASIKRLKMLVAKRIGGRPINLSLTYEGRILDNNELVKVVFSNGGEAILDINPNTLYEKVTAPPVIDKRVPVQHKAANTEPLL